MNRMAFRRIDIQQLLEPFRPHLVIGGEQIKGVCVRLVPESRQQPEERDAERVPVARRRGRSTCAQFRREIPVGTHHGTRSTRLARHKCRRNLKLVSQVRVDDTRNTEVRENRMALRIDQDIVELDVTMHDALRMAVAERLDQVGVEPLGVRLRDLARRTDGLQRRGFACGIQDQVHHEVGMSVRIDSDVLHVHKPRMRQAFQDTPFGNKPLLQEFDVSMIGGKALQRPPCSIWQLDFKNRSHAARSQRTDNSICSPVTCHWTILTQTHAHQQAPMQELYHTSSPVPAILCYNRITS